MKNFYPAKEIARILGVTKRAVHKRANKESWPYRTQTGRGGKRKLYGPVQELPPDVQEALVKASVVSGTPPLTYSAESEKKRESMIEMLKKMHACIKELHSFVSNKDRRLSFIVLELNVAFLGVLASISELYFKSIEKKDNKPPAPPGIPGKPWKSRKITIS